MSRKNGLLAISLVFVLALIYTVWRSSKTGSLEEKYFDNINFSFKGVVSGGYEYDFSNQADRDKQPGAGPKFNIYYLDIIYTTESEYDPRDSTSAFYCLIKKDRIYLIERTIHENINGNDIIEFNGLVDSTYHYKIKRRKDNGKSYYDTILYDKWRPSNIFWDVHRENLVKKVLKHVPR